jgi:LPXTG-motif cell wall-anchored protein
VTTTAYVDGTPSPLGSLVVVPQPVAPGEWIVTVLEAGSAAATSTTGSVVLASTTETLPASGDNPIPTVLVGIALSAAGALITRRRDQEAE